MAQTAQISPHNIAILHYFELNSFFFTWLYIYLTAAVIQLAKLAGAKRIYATGKGTHSNKCIESLGGENVGSDPRSFLPSIEVKLDISIESVCTYSYDSIQKVLNTTGKLVYVGVISTIIIDSVFPNLLGNYLLPKLELQRPLISWIMLLFMLCLMWFP